MHTRVRLCMYEHAHKCACVSRRGCLLCRYRASCVSTTFQCRTCPSGKRSPRQTSTILHPQLASTLSQAFFAMARIRFRYLGGRPWCGGARELGEWCTGRDGRVWPHVWPHVGYGARWAVPPFWMLLAAGRRLHCCQQLLAHGGLVSVNG
jgi:hypothetical protein